MIVTRENINKVLEHLGGRDVLALDTETTGLRPYHGDEPFSVIIHDGDQGYYFNFNDYPDMGENERLDWKDYSPLLQQCFAKERLWYLHNAKFDMAMLEAMGVKLAGQIHDTMVVARVLDSTLWQGDFSLDACAKRLGYEKLDTVKTYLLANKLYTVEKSEGKKTQKKNFHFQLAPWDLIVPYGERDAEITFQLGQRQRLDLTEICQLSPGLRQVYDNECKLLRTVYDIEKRGVRIDLDFCQRAAINAKATQAEAAQKFEFHAGEPFKDSTVVFQRVFAAERDRWVWGEVTPTGKKNPSFDSDVLATFESPAAKAVVRWRKAKSDANYYHGFLYETDKHGVIHASLNQHMAATGRFSSSNPNLQNLTKNDDEELAQEFIVRRAVIPRAGMVFHMLDYQQMEYRLMLDYAAGYACTPAGRVVDKDGVIALIAKVLGGLDVHQATADVAGVSRRDAKTVNFATLYGSGITNLAHRLARSEQDTRAIRDTIFRAAPEILTFIRRATDAAEKRGYVNNWHGRRYLFPDSKFAYRAPNYLIQGGCADIVKIAMNKVADYLEACGAETRMVLMVHDELVLEGPPSEAEAMVPVVKKIMEQVYPAKHVPLTCDVDHSFKSLADKVKGVGPCVAS